jgi:hypothetical protein
MEGNVQARRSFLIHSFVNIQLKDDILTVEAIESDFIHAGEFQGNDGVLPELVATALIDFRGWFERMEADQQARAGPFP